MISLNPAYSLFLALTLLMPDATHAQQGFVPPDARQIAKAERAVVFIQAKGLGRPSTATGFVIAHNGRMVIITVAHVLRGGLDVSAQFHNHPQGVICDPIDYSDELDLMALVPRPPLEFPPNVETLELDPDFEFNHQLSPSVWLYARPGAQAARHVLGYINAKPIAAGELHRTSELAMRSVKSDRTERPHDRPTPRGQTRLIQYVTNLDPGTSGGPLLNHDGKVIAVQSGRMLNSDGTLSSSVFYAVSTKHLQASGKHTVRALDLTNTIENGTAKVLPALNLRARPQYKFTTVAPATIKLRDRQFNVECIDNGLVPQDAVRVIDEFMQDPESFRATFGADTLGQYLKHIPVTFITNPAFGLAFLKPDSYDIASEPLEEKLGLQLTIRAPDLRAASPYSPLIKILVFTADEYQIVNHKEWSAVAAQSLVDFKEKNPTRRIDAASFQQNVIKRLMLAEIAAQYEREELGLEHVDDDTVCYMQDKTHILKKVPVSDAYSKHTDRFGVQNTWFRVNYVDDVTKRILAIHCGSFENVALIAFYRCRQEDMDAFINGGAVNQHFLDQRLIRSSLSFY